MDSKTKEHYKRLARANESKNRSPPKSPKVPEFEDILAEKRSIYLQNLYRIPKSTADIINEQMNELCRAAKDTSQYIKLVNVHIENQKTHMDDLKDIQKVLDEQTTSLTSEDPPEKKKTSTK
ncbi:MAG TPA: hypothetical protein VLF17_05700 [Candidatus Nitrosotenuis sp.]|nr:hypothetical protein [Candidatus Nitrosotenuis sp.]